MKIFKNLFKFRKKKKRIGLALGSGGGKGLAHIGVIKALVENDISINAIAGTSAGALIGGLYACLGDISKVEEIFRSLRKRDVLKLLSKIGMKSGLINDKYIIKFIEDKVGEVKIQDLDIPFCAIATDYVTGKSIEFNTGSLSKAIRISSSIPVLFEPYIEDNMILVDGGTSLPVPVSSLAQFDVDVKIAVNLDSSLFPLTHIDFDKKVSTSMFDIAKGSVELLNYHLSQQTASSADIIINPKVDEVDLIRAVDRLEYIDEGYEITLENMDRIKKCCK